MRVAFFDTHPFEKDAFEAVDHSHQVTYFESRLTESTASLAKDFPCVCAFANDRLNHEVLSTLQQGGVQLIALRSAGFNHVDLISAKKLGLKVVRVPEYSPYAIAEHVVALIQTLNRKTHRAYNRVREGNFSLSGLVGFDLHAKTIGIVGTGRIGKVLARIMQGFGTQILLFDLMPDEKFAKEINAKYVSLKELLNLSDIISLHVPLTPKTKHFIDEAALQMMKKGVMIINTGRGALIDSKALIGALKSGQVGAAGLDVYEEEEGVFFQDLSGKILTDEVLLRLLSFPNVLITSHQGFLTQEALNNIAQTTLNNISAFDNHQELVNQVL